ncbi:MAG TPA: amidohydrolase family protein [Sphingobacteriaceae bacterium]|nr:amidohydrolase family protein [Sphingobacteriaceae bacterium]
MVRNVSADYIFPINSEPIKNGIVSIAPDGEIIGLYPSGSPDLKEQPVEHHDGILVPGFVNAHCHLELSHLHQKIPVKEGLIPFIQHVMDKRKTSDEKGINEAMVRADQMMADNGIVAVGDISNTGASIPLKQKSSIYYHTFIELLGFFPDNASTVFTAGQELRKQFNGLPSSIAPHSPYSISKDLFKIIRKYCDDNDNILTIHNQESEEENKFFRYKKGGFPGFFETLKQDIDFFKPQARNSIQTIIPLMPENCPILLVHNTYTSLKDIYFIRRFGRQITWCFCPNANLYIEDRIPKIEMFLTHNFNITLGTDSLASNDQLCMLSEIKVIQDRFPGIPLNRALSWATLNGARFLGIDNKFGSLETGKKPGLNLITNVVNSKLSADSKVKRIL